MATGSKNGVREVGAYLISGGAYFWSGYAAFFVFDQGFHLSLFWAKLLSTAIGLLINFLLQHFWVFGTHQSPAKLQHVSLRYLVVTATDFFIDYLVVRQLQKWGISPYIGTFISAGIFTVWNYFWYKFWVFKPAS